MTSRSSRPPHATTTGGSSFGNEETLEERWSFANLEYVRKLWSLDDEQFRELVAMKKKLKDVDHWKNSPYEVIRFVTGPQGFDKAEELFRDMVEWRLENNVDTILDTYKPPQILLDYLPSAILAGYDKEGDPIYLERGGAMDGPGLLARFGRERLLKHIIWSRELAFRGRWIEEYERKQKRPPTRLTIVYDLQGLSSRHLKAGVLPLLNEAMMMTQLRYNGIAKKMIVIRAPSLFNFVWNVCKFVFPPKARKKMVFSGPYNYLEVLDKFIDRDVLPPCIVPNGKGLVAIDMPSNLNGGIIPEDIYGLEEEEEEEEEEEALDKCGRLTTVPDGYDSTTSLETDSDYSDGHPIARTCRPVLNVRVRRITGGWWNGNNPANNLRVLS